MENNIYDEKRLNQAVEEFKQLMGKKYKKKVEDKTREQIFKESLEKIQKVEQQYRKSNHPEYITELLKFKDFIIDNSSDVAKGAMLNVLLQRNSHCFTIYSSNQIHDFYANLAEVYKKDIFEMLSFLIRSVEQEFKTESEEEIELVFDNMCTPDEIAEYERKANGEI